MKVRKARLQSLKHRYFGPSLTRNLCPRCRALKPRQGVGPSTSLPGTLTQRQVVSAMYAYLMTSWEELPEQNKRALGFDSVVGGEEEEAALNRLATLFMEYADVSLRRALVARRRRLGEGK
ncbi:Uncharacterized protein ALO68_04081 [Pseudomonas syringae pv. helianthi]|uniref:Uncharacterized protein n=1 Tax=Pseudomonas syringae pv. helianthi TaxID=251654 RepID=A0A0P9SKE0_9PSED|nr:hypothetical protein [Pseudomonas syringae group genomosp. 7]KPX43408.1 Uncharacterized protein ALO68_04081 [Pseudomonas syringae pv. helianthi]UNB63753.1 hypothetical protein MME54_02760 [Pseudomonas syringae pv. helianthi]